MVHAQRRNGGSADRCDAKHIKVLPMPGEMLLPLVFSRMKKPNNHACEGVFGVRFFVLATVANFAGVSKVLQIVGSA